MAKLDCYGNKIPPPPSYEGSWAATVNTPTSLDYDIRTMRDAPAIMQEPNMVWFARKHRVSKEQARELLGYLKPLATYTAEEYRAMSFRGGG